MTNFINDKQSRKKTSITKRWFKAESYLELATLLGATDWSPMETITCEEASEHLERNIIEAMDKVAPVETKKVKNKPENQWLTLGIKTSLAHAAKLYHKYKSSKKVIDKMAYKN